MAASTTPSSSRWSPGSATAPISSSFYAFTPNQALQGYLTSEIFELLTGLQKGKLPSLIWLKVNLKIIHNWPSEVSDEDWVSTGRFPLNTWGLKVLFFCSTSIRTKSTTFSAPWTRPPRGQRLIPISENDSVLNLIDVFTKARELTKKSIKRKMNV